MTNESLELYELATLTTGDFAEFGIFSGDEGLVIEDFNGEAYLVDFSKDAENSVILTVKRGDLTAMKP